jgi:hypothetical protein
MVAGLFQGLVKTQTPAALRLMAFCTNGIEDNDRFGKRSVFDSECPFGEDEK